MNHDQPQPSFFSADDTGTPPPADSDSPPADSALRQSGSLGDYDLLETLGEGGMGVVYLARQRSANRMVALKVIRPDRLGGLLPQQRRRVIDRFQTEARAAAQLDHDHIVTIYDVGEQDGQQYFSMRYVAGDSLADRLRDGPLGNRQAAIYLEQVCRAVDEAHRRGVLHRDLKPQNILIDLETDRALVADFGLAKLAEQEEALTRDGDVMGTPQYMSPEQAQDSASVTAHSDVYALGATLYHMLTGRPVFQAATVWETLRQVIDQPPVPPRALNQDVHLDLDTICLKCLEKDASRRFESAGDLADELARYLAGQPIRSRPIGPLGRLIRWSRRNPLVAITSAAALTCLVGILVTVSVALVETRQAYRRSEQSFKQALGAVNDFLTTVSEETLLDQPGLKPLRQDLLRLALNYYERFLTQRAGDPSVRDLLADSNYRVGLITSEIESDQQALPFFERAIVMQRQLVSESLPRDEYAAALAMTLNAKGESLFGLGRIPDALDCFRESNALRRSLWDERPDSIELGRLLANTHMNMGIVHKESQEFESARTEFETARMIRDELLLLDSSDIKLLRDVAKGHYSLGDLYDLSDLVSDAKASFDASITVFEQLSRRESTFDDQYYLSGAYFGRAALLEDADAVDDYRRALQQVEPLAALNPNVDKLHSMVLSCRLELAFCYSRMQQHSQAMQSLQVAEKTAYLLAHRDPSYLHDLTQVLLEIAKNDNGESSEPELLKRYQQEITAARDEFPDAQLLRDLQQQLTESLAKDGAAPR